MWKLKYDTNELIYEIETDSQTQRKKKLMVIKGWGRDKLGVSDQQIQTTIYKIDKQQGPIVQHRKIYSITYNKPHEKIYSIYN